MNKKTKWLLIMLSAALLAFVIAQPLSIFFYGGVKTIYVGDAIDVSLSRSSAELTSPCEAGAKHIFRIYREYDALKTPVAEKIEDIGIISFVNNRYMFSDGSVTQSFSYRAKAGYPLVVDKYYAKEWIECSGSVITKNVQIYYFEIVEKPRTVTTVKECGNLGQNLKTRSCYYKTCYLADNGDWRWSLEKQSSTFCDYVPKLEDYTTIPQSPACISVWKVSEWSECRNSIQTRSVWDNHYCSLSTGDKPESTRKCTEAPVIIEPIIEAVGDSFEGTESESGKPTFIQEYMWHIVLIISFLFVFLTFLVMIISKKG